MEEIEKLEPERNLRLTVKNNECDLAYEIPKSLLEPLLKYLKERGY
jgi:hypothetical protein